ncbi:MAG: aminoglycoside phosphotransferase family protein [Treponema sp.]|nr:aminoglycoside phosphotransferase family protein [Treponema sp.]
MNENKPAVRPADIVKEFLIYGVLLDISPMGNGHINDTFISAWNQGGTVVRYTHQRINHHVFIHPEEVMENICRVTSHIRAKLGAAGGPDIGRRVLEVVPCRTGKPWFRDKDGYYWRTYCYIEKSRTGETVTSAQEAELLGRSAGRFQKQLADLGGPRLFETIVNFHNMETRYVSFHKALEKDEFNRAKNAGPEIEFYLENEDRGGILIRSMRNRLIPERICHNDAKLSNILLDDETGAALCVIDLDTVMPGSSLFDLGDLIRTVTITAAEDEQDLAKVGFNPVLYRALLKGYLGEALEFLTSAELKLLCESGRNLAHIMGLRFLTDYLEGDHYYHTSRPGHNLDRTRTQMTFIRSMDKQWAQAEQITRDLTSEAAGR